MTQSNEVDFATMTEEKIEILAAALKALGYHVTVGKKKHKGSKFEGYDLTSDNLKDFSSVLVKDGKVIVGLKGNSAPKGTTIESVTAKLKPAYSEAVVKAAAERFGWLTSKQDSGKISLRRRF